MDCFAFSAKLVTEWSFKIAFRQMANFVDSRFYGGKFPGKTVGNPNKCINFAAIGSGSERKQPRGRKKPIISYYFI